MDSPTRSGNGVTLDDRGNLPHPAPATPHAADPPDDLESLRQQTERLYARLSEADAKVEQFQQQLALAAQQIAAADRLAQHEQQEKHGLLQQLWETITARDSLRGKLGNLTRQRNELQRRLLEMTEERDRLQQELKAMLNHLVVANQSIERLEAEFDQDMTELANAYRAMNPAQRLGLPPALKTLLDQVEQDYWK